MKKKQGRGVRVVDASTASEIAAVDSHIRKIGAKPSQKEAAMPYGGVLPKRRVRKK